MAQVERQDALALFLRMDSASTPLSYKGLVTYERGEQLSTMSIVRHHVDGQLVEQVEVLSGSPGRLTRRAERFACVDETEASADGAGFALTDYYTFHHVGSDLVAGRETHELLVVPRDQNRLAYLYSVDRDTGMMLRSIAMLPDRTVLERLQFVDYQTIEEPLERQSGADTATEQSEPLQMWLDDCRRAKIARTGWIPGWMPAGFVAVSADADPGLRSAELVYSDGVANLSLFVEPISEIAFPTETAQRGATAIHVGYLKLGDQVFMVTVAGEVPPAVLVEVARSMNFLELPATEAGPDEAS